MKAEDLQKALDPSVWPMRVKVREYIYYAKRHPKQDGGAAGATRQQGGPGGGAQQHGAEQAVGHGQHVHPGPSGQPQVKEWQGAPTSNMFAGLETPAAPAVNGL